jgi:hypothetical protein
VPVLRGQLYIRLPNDWPLFVGPVDDAVNPLTVRLEVAPQVARGTAGAPVVIAPLELQFEPFAKTRVAAEPTKCAFEVLVKFTTPVLATVTIVPMPPVVVNLLFAVPPKVIVPAILPVALTAAVANTILTPLAALFIINALPAWISRSSPTPPPIVKVRVVEAEEERVNAVLSVILKTPAVGAATVIIAPVIALPGVVPAPSTTRISVAAGVERFVPELSALVFQVAAALKSAVADPTQ